MNAKDILRQVIESADMIVRIYVSDLSDADLLVRSVPGTNHIAWQLGHMIAGSRKMLEDLGQPAPSLPAAFAATYTPAMAGSDDASCFAGKEEYLSLLAQMKTAMLAAVDATPEERLGDPGPEPMREYAPTVATALLILGNHWLMHAGQFVPIRRKLGKSPLF